MKIVVQSFLKLKLILGLLSFIFVQFSFGQGGPNAPSLDLGDDLLVCAGNNNVIITALLSNAGGSGASYSWSINGASVSGSTSILTLNASLTAANPQVLSCIATLTNNTTITDQINIYTIDPGVIANNQFACSVPFDPSLFTSTSAGSTTLSGITATYQWQSSTNGITWTDILGATNDTYDQGSTSTSTYFRRAIICTLNSMSVTCYSNEVEIGILNPGSIGNDQIICLNDIPQQLTSTLDGSITIGATVEYQWQSSTDNITWVNLSSANLPSYAPSSLSVTTYFRRVASLIYNSQPICDSYSNTVTIEVLGNLSLNAGTNITTCVGEDVTLNPTITGLSGNTPVYAWTGPGGFSSSVLNPSINNITSSASGTYTLTTTVGNCIIPDDIDIEVVEIGITTNLPFSNNQIVKCLNPGDNTGNIVFQFILPSTTSNIQSIEVNWGDGVIQNITTFSGNKVHNYVPGYYDITITMTTTSGCSQVLQYTAFVGSSPSPASLTLAINQANGCMPHTTNYTFNQPAQNVNGTVYTVNWGDGSPIETYVHPNAPSTLTHVYYISSCGNNIVTNTGTYYNVFQPSVQTTNPCTSQPQPSAAGLISVGEPPEVDFEISDTTICPGGTIQITDNSNYGLTLPLVTGASCISTSPFYWTITNASGATTGYSVVTGSLGDNGGDPMDEYIWTNGTPNLSVQFNTPGVYTITMHIKNLCGLDEESQTICVITPPVSSIVPVNAVQCSPYSVALNSNSTLPMCGTSPTPVAYQWSITNPSGCSNCSSTIASASSENTSAVLTNNSSTIQTYTVSLSLTPLDPITNQPVSSPGCAHTSTTTIQVYPAVTFTNGNTVTLCSNGSLAQNLTTNVNPNQTFTWYASPNSNVSGISTTPQNTNLINDQLNNLTTSPQYVNYTVTATSSAALGSCTNNQTVYVTVNPSIVLTDPADLVLCPGVSQSAISFVSIPPTGVTYNWTNSNSSIGVATAGSGSIPSFNPVNNTGGNISATITVTPQIGICYGAAQSFTITVKPMPTVSGNSDQSICLGQSFNSITFSSASGVANSTFNWSNSNTAIGLGASGSGNISAFAPSVSGNATITVTPTANGCTGTGQSFTLTVNPIPVINSINDLTICAGSSSPVISFGSNVSGTIYTWSNSNTSIGLTASNGTGSIGSFTAQNSTNGPISSTISVTPSANGCSGASTSFVITINPKPTVDALSPISLCNGESTSLISFSSSLAVPNTVFNWTNDNSSIGLSSSGTGNISAFSVTNSGNTNSVANITVTPVANGCSGDPVSFQITVKPTPTASISSAQTFCPGAATQAIVFSSSISNSVATTTYSWTNSNTNIGLTASSGTGNIGSFTAANSTSSNITSTISVIPTAAGCVGNPQSTTITVLTSPTVNTLSNQVYCPGNSVSASALSGNYSTGMSYVWSVSGASIGLSSTTGTSSSIPAFTASNSGTAPLTATVTVTPSVTQNGQTCAGAPTAAYTITVNPIPDMPAFSPQLFVFCEDEQALVPFTANITSGMTFNWTNDNTQIGVAATGTSTSPGLSFTAENNLSYPNNIPLTSNFYVTPIYTNQGVACPGSPEFFAITVNPKPDVNPVQDITYCATETGYNQFTSFNQITGSGGTSYVWTNTNTAIGLLASGTGDFYFTSTNTTLAPISGTVAVTPTYTNNGVTCEGDIEEFEITINPMPTVDPISSQGWCLGETTTAVNPTGNLSTAVYNWTNNNTSTGLGPNGAGLIPSFVGLNTTNAPNVSTVSVVPSYTNNNVTCVGATQEFGITINPMPNINPIADQQVCAQDPASVQFTSTPNVAGTIYNWTNDNPAIGLGALGSGSLSFNATNTTSAPITAEIIVTPSFTFAGSTCTGVSDTFNIVVLPTPVMNPLSDETICAGTPTSALNFSSNLSGTEYTWANSNGTIGLGLSGTGNSIGSFNGINSGTAPSVGIITVTPSLTTNSQQCFGSPVSATITVNPIPVMNTVNTLSFCYGAAASIPLSSNINTNVSYNWTNNNTEIGLNASGNGSISFNTANPYSTAISGSVTVSPEYSYNNVQCPGNSSTFTIQVAPNPEVNTLSNVDFCSGQQTTVIPISGTVTGATYSWTNANPAIGLTGPGTGNIPVFTATNSSTTSVASSLVTVTPSLSFNGQSCQGPSAQFIISIIPGTTINSIPDVQLCNGESSIAINFSGSGSSYTWSSNNPNIGIAGSGNTSIQSFVATNPSTTPIDATITVTSQFTGGFGCNGGSTSFNIEVLPTPSVIDPTDIVECHNDPVAAVPLIGVATNYVWTNNTPSIGLTNTGSTATIPVFIASNTGASPVTATVTITPSYVSGTKTCTGTAQNYTITVIPTPTITSQPQSQTVCLGGTLNALNVTYAGGSGTPTYQWYSNTSNNNTGGTAILGATAASCPLVAASSTGINYYYCVMTFANSATCSQLISEVATISITNGPSITAQPLSSQSICVGGSISAPLTVGFANGTGNSTFQWYSVVGGTNTAIAGESGIDFMPGVFNTAGTYSYMVQISLSGSGCGVATSNTVQINVLADPTVTSPVDANYCLNSSTAVPLTVMASGGVSVPYTYQWYSNTVSNNTSGTVIAAATAASYIPPATTVGTVYYYCQVSQGNGCSVNSNLAAIEITTAPTISAQPLNTQTVCLDGTLTPLSVNYTNGSGTPQYQWYSNSQNSYIGGVAIPGETSSTYTPSTANTGTIYYYCNISFTQSGCSSISSNISQVIVIADPVITTNPLATQTICSGGTIPAALSVDYQFGIGNVSYQWYSVNNGVNSPISGATSANYTPPVYNSAGPFTYAVQVSLSGSGCNQVLSNTAEVIVLPDPSVSNPISATYCNGYTPVAPLSVAAGGGLSGNFDYQWYSNSVNSNSNGQILLGETAPSFTPPVTTNGTVYYYCVVSQGAANTGCLVQSAPAMITTNAAPNFSSQPLGFQEACVGGTLTNLTVSYTGGSTNPTYQWYSSATNNNTGGTPIIGANSATYLPPNTTAGTNYYYCVISFPSISCTTITSAVVEVLIHADPIISIQPLANQAICFGTTLNQPLEIAYTGGYGTPTYQWSAVDNGNPIIIGQATNSTYLPPVFNVSSTFYYQAQLTLSGNGCDVQLSNLAEVIVAPVPNIDPVESFLYCNGDLSDLIEFNGTIANTTYYWENDNPAIGLAANGFGNIVPFTVTNMNNFGLTGNITVTPQVTIYNTVCSGTPAQFTIMVNPYQDVQDPQDLVLCHGTGVNGIQFFGTALMNNWTNDLPALGIPSSGTGSIPAFLAVNNGTQPIVANLSVTPSFNAPTTCPGDIETFTITILPNPSVALSPATQSLCSGDVSTTINFTGVATSFDWTNTTPSIGLAGSGSGNIPGFVTSATGSNTTATIEVTPIYTYAGQTCEGMFEQAQITVLPAPSVQPLPDIVVCNGDATGLISIIGNASELNWSSSNPSIGTANLGSGTIPSFNAINTGQNPVSTVITVTPVNYIGSFTCLAPTIDFSIIVNPTPTVNPILDQVLCANDNSPAVLFSGNATNFTWTNSETSIGLAASGSNLIGSFITQNTLPSVLSATINVTPEFTNAGYTCYGVPELFAIDVLPEPTINAVNPQVLCNGAATTPLDFVGNATNYTWINNNTSIGLAANGNGDIPAFNTFAGSTNNVANIVITPQYTYNNTTCSGTPTTTQITVLPSPYINTMQDVVLCDNEASGVISISGTATSFDWNNSNPSIGLLASGTGSIGSFSASNLSSNPVIATITVTPQSALNNTTCSGNPEQFTITVNPTPVVNPISNKILCSQDQSAPVNFSGGVQNNAISYSWLNSNPSIGLPSNGSGNINAFTAQNNGSLNATAQIQVTPYYTHAGVSCPGQTQNFNFTIEPIPTIQYSQIAQEICSGATTNEVVISSPTPGVNFSWAIVNPSMVIGGVSNMSGNGNIPPMTLSNTTNTTAQFNFQGTASTPLLGCTGTGAIGTISVYPTPILPPLNDLTLCSNDVLNVILNATVPSNYEWSASTNPYVIGQPSGIVSSPLIFNTLQNITSTLQSITYTITPTTNLPYGCVGPTESFNVEVVPDIVLNTQITPLDTAICSNELTNIFLQTNYPALINWHAINNPNVSGETTTATTGNYISDILVNNTPFNQYVQYYVDMVSSPQGCNGIPELITVLVYPAIQLTNVTNINLCSNEQLDLNLAATVNANFTWSATNNGVVQGESTTPQNNSLLNDLLVNNSAFTEQVFYSVDVLALNSGCQAYDLPITVNVLPLPVLLNNDITICSGQLTNVNLVTNIPASIVWNGVFNIPILGETYANISGNYINDLLVNNTGQDETLVYEVLATSNGCTAPLDYVLVIVHDQPDIDFSILNNPICSQDNVQFINLSNPNFDFDWSFGDGATSEEYSPLHIYNNSGIYEVMLVGTNPLNNCSADESLSIVVNKMPDASFYTMDNIGCGDLNATFFANYQATSDMVWDFGDGQTLTQVGNVTNYYGQSGCYDVTLTVTSPEGCVAQESYGDYVCVYENPIAFIGASPTSVNALTPTIQFSNASQNAISYMWQMGDGTISYDDNPTYTYPMEGADYNVLMTAYNEVGCFDTASVSIHVYEDLIYYVPNTFTPNDDEKNQTFYPILSQGMKRTYMDFYIYNRWGELVFESHDPAYGWDGTYGPTALDSPIGTYTWKLKLETLQTQEIVEFHGHVNLIR